MRIAAFGIAADVPHAWDARVYRRAADPGEATHPVLHAASFPLPATRGDFGSGAVDVMGRDDVFVAVRDYGPGAAGTALFAARGVPTLIPGDFSPTMLQRPLPGHSGCQRFFTTAGRGFCLYVVLGSHARRVPLSRAATTLIAGLELS